MQALPEKAEEVFQRMLDHSVRHRRLSCTHTYTRAHAHVQVQPDIITFNTIISAYANASPGRPEV